MEKKIICYILKFHFFILLKKILIKFDVIKFFFFIKIINLYEKKEKIE
jgi:hypothetical protein